MMCAHAPAAERTAAARARSTALGERAFDGCCGSTRARLALGAAPPARRRSLVTLATIALNVYLYVDRPQGLLPAAGHRPLIGSIQADQDISFPAMQRQDRASSSTSCRRDPAVDTVVGLHRAAAATPRTPAGCSSSLKPLERAQGHGRPGHRPAARASSRSVPGATLFLQAVQDMRIGGRASNAQYQYTLQSDEPRRARTRARPEMLAKLRKLPELRDVNTDQQNRGLAGRARRSTATPPRASASRRR